VGLEKERASLLESLLAESERKLEATKQEQTKEASSPAPANNAVVDGGRTGELAAKLGKYAGARTAVYAVNEAPGAADAASLINATLTNAGLFRRPGSGRVSMELRELVS
jgi:hypothetical protein